MGHTCKLVILLVATMFILVPNQGMTIFDTENLTRKVDLQLFFMGEKYANRFSSQHFNVSRNFFTWI